MPQINFDYAHVPTIGRFSNSDAFIRALIGPFGCLPAETEFLTPTGWKRMGEYEPGDLVAQWWQSGRVDFIAPAAYVDKPAPDGFLRFESGSLVMALSSDHRVPHYNWDGRFQVLTAGAIAKKISRRKIPTTFSVLGRLGLDMSDDLIRFAVMMHADGHYVRNRKQAVVTVRKERKKIRIRYLLAALGIAYREKTYPRRPTETLFSFYPPYRGKRFNGDWWKATQAQLEIILDEQQYWDGLFGYPEQRYFSAFKEDADFIQYAAHATGRRATITPIAPQKAHHRTVYNTAIKSLSSYKNVATLRAEAVITTIPASDGRQYCFTVPSGFFVVRHEDTIFITGNSGKSSGCVVEFPYRAQMQAPGPDGVRRTRWAVVRNTARELRDTTIRTFHQWLPPQYFGRWYETDSRYVIKSFANTEFEILFRGLDQPEDVKKLLSLDLTGGWINEVREVPWAIVEALQGRCGRYPPKDQGGPTWSGIWMDTNPPDVDSKFYKFFEDEDWKPDFEELLRSGALPPGITRPEDYAQIFHQPSGLSPEAENLVNLPAGYYARLGIGKGLEWKKVYIEGRYGFVSDDKTVFPEYRDEVHLKEKEPIPGVPIERTWDWGLTPCCIFSQILPSGQWLIFDEMMATSMGADRFSDQVLEHCAKAFRGRDVSFDDLGDPAGEIRGQSDEKTCFDIVQAKGVMIRGGEQNLAMRLESVRKGLRTLADNGEPRLILHPRCRTIRKAFLGGYHYRRLKTGAERYSDDPDKNHPYSDVADCVEYRAVEHFGAGLTGHLPQDDYPERPRDMTGRSRITGY